MLGNLLDGATGTNNIAIWIMLPVVLVLLIGYMVWSFISNKKKQKEAKETLDAIKVGDKVKTIGGICGYIVEIDKEENTFVLETGTKEKRSYVKFDKQAIYQTAPANGMDGDVVAPAPAEPEKAAEKEPVKEVAEQPAAESEEKTEEKAE